MSRKTFLCYLYLAFSFVSISQNQIKIDSLLSVLQHTTRDTQIVMCYNKLVTLYALSDLNKAEEYANKSVDLAQKSSYKSGLAEAYNLQGFVYTKAGKSNQALKSLDLSLQLYTELKNKIGIASVYGHMGNFYFLIDDFENSMEFDLKALKIYEEEKNDDGIARMNMNISGILSFKKEYSNSKSYLFKSKQVFQRLHNVVNEAICLANIGNVFLLEGALDSAKFYFEELKKFSEINKLDNSLASSIRGFGQVCFAKKDYKNAHFYFEKSFSLYEKIGMKAKCIEIQTDQIEIYQEEEAYTKVIEYAKKCLPMTDELNQKTVKLDLLNFLSVSYAKLKKYEIAYDYMLQYIELHDSVIVKTYTNNIDELQVKFETNEKEKENKLLASQNQIQALELKQKNYVMLVLLAVFVIGGLLFWVFIQQQKLKSQRQSIKLEQRLLRSQMNPHFIFNSLASIESFIYDNEPKEAGLYLSQFARLMRLILENSAEEFISLKKEIETLNYYLSLQKLRMYDKFNYTIDIDSSIETEEIDIPPMLTQPFIENAIEHGFKGNKQEGMITIKYSLQEDVLLVEIIDNGIGILEAQKHKKAQDTHKSMALKITEERLLFLNRTKKKKMLFSITDLSTENELQQGTKICFSIPI